jgi:hypothetical protein
MYSSLVAVVVVIGVVVEGQGYYGGYNRYGGGYRGYGRPRFAGYGGGRVGGPRNRQASLVSKKYFIYSIFGLLLTVFSPF